MLLILSVRSEGAHGTSYDLPSAVKVIMVLPDCPYMFTVPPVMSMVSVSVLLQRNCGAWMPAFCLFT